MKRVLTNLIKVIPDTNIIISGLLWHGDPRQILNLAEAKEIELYGSEETYKEFCDVIKRPKFQKILASNIYTPEKLILDYQGLINMVSLYNEFAGIKIVEDEDDNIFFRAAKIADAKIIVSKDVKHVLKIKKFDNIHVVEPDIFLKIFPKLKQGKIS